LTLSWQAAKALMVLVAYGIDRLVMPDPKV
jgi:hypothetical protein